MKRLSILLAAALLLAGLASVVSVNDPWPSGNSKAAVSLGKPAAATGGACGGLSWFDDPGLSYPNGDYKATTGGNYTNLNTGHSAHLNFDIQSWRLTGAGGGFIAGHCYRRDRISVWTSDGWSGNLWMHARVWANSGGSCTQLVYDYWPPSQYANSSEWYTPWYDYSGCGGPNADGYGFGSDSSWTPQPAWNSVPYAYAGLP